MQTFRKICFKAIYLYNYNYFKLEKEFIKIIIIASSSTNNNYYIYWVF